MHNGRPDLVPYPLAKRATDKLVAALLLLLLSPLFAIAFSMIALGMLLHPADRGSWFYRERRMTRGREFDVLKFRVLRESALAQLRTTKGAYARTFERDPNNLTWAGRLLKVMYIDELPQLFNILRGQLSLVGPRPWPLSMVEQQLAQGHDYRHRVVAGWTGPSQVRKDAPRKSYSALDLDLEYVEACRTLSGPKLVWHDLKILTESVKTVFRRQGLRY